MAKTWRTGEFGLTSFDDHNLEFNELIQHFNDNINENFVDLSIVSDISTADIQIALDVSTTDMGKDDISYTDIALASNNIYTDIAKSSVPVSGYEDRIKNT